MTADLGEKVVVCLLTYNHVDIITSTIRTILDQTISGYEVIVSDDCSSDGTWERILELAASDSRIKPVRTPRNMGMPGNANFAVAQSSRPYIALLHHDDLYRNDLLEKWTGVLDDHSDIAFVFNPYGDANTDIVHQGDMPGVCIDGSWLLKNHLFGRWGCVVRGTAMIRRAAWEQVGGMREEFDLLADVDLWMRLAMRSSVGYVSEPLITLRQSRPPYYPEMYRSGSFSWRRQRFLYEIHASNRLAYLKLNTLGGRFQWWWFRLRLSLETGKWLAYSVVRRKSELISTMGDSVTQYDLLPLRLFRSVLQMVSTAAVGRRA